MNGPRLPRWLYPGMHIKRWIGTLLVGLTILALGAAILLIELYRRAIIEYPELAAAWARSWSERCGRRS